MAPPGHLEAVVGPLGQVGRMPCLGEKDQHSLLQASLSNF